MADIVFVVMALIPHLLLWIMGWALVGYLVWCRQFFDQDWKLWLQERARRRLTTRRANRMKHLDIGENWLRLHEPKWFDESPRNLRIVALGILFRLGPFGMFLHVGVSGRASWRRIVAQFRSG